MSAGPLIWRTLLGRRTVGASAAASGIKQAAIRNYSNSSSSSSKALRPTRGRKHPLRKSAGEEEAERRERMRKREVIPTGHSSYSRMFLHVSMFLYISLCWWLLTNPTTELAYDSFFAGFRPIPIRAQSEPQPEFLDFEAFNSEVPATEMDEPMSMTMEFDLTSLDYPIGTFSASGAVLDPVMASIPKSELAHIRGNLPPAAPGASNAEHRSAYGEAAMTTVLEKLTAAVEGSDSDTQLDMASAFKCLLMASANGEGVNELARRMDERFGLQLMGLTDNGEVLEFLRPLNPPRVHRRSVRDAGERGMQLTSVVRKRRLKMKKHKLKKRRKAERALRRKQG
ncbi:hypothetical protein BZA70DRAFT_283191 [Myxozyma melibiosi]|uniref:Small ribosomal subunit protein mS38 n=1 Tax=Myxozyma melibiosi TaxID=54550 RepID=A0ABR1F1H0_9ASCO